MAQPPRQQQLAPQKSNGGPPVKKSQTLEEIIAAKAGTFAEVSTKYLSTERLVKLAQAMVSRTPDLRKCSPLSVVSELMTCSRLGLEPGVEGGRWLLPFKVTLEDGTTRYDVVGVTDYRGLIDIARRSGEVLAIHADVRHEKDLWEFWIDAGGPTLVHLRHCRAEGPRGDILGAFAVVKLRNGEIQATYLGLDEINATKGRSKSAKSSYSPWNTDWESMARKTAIRRLYNLLPKTPEIQAAREAIAEEEERDRAEVAIDVTPPSSSRTEDLKAKLKARAVPEQAAPETGAPTEEDFAQDLEHEAEREPGEDG